MNTIIVHMLYYIHVHTYIICKYVYIDSTVGYMNAEGICTWAHIYSVDLTGARIDGHVGAVHTYMACSRGGESCGQGLSYSFPAFTSTADAVQTDSFRLRFLNGKPSLQLQHCLMPTCVFTFSWHQLATILLGVLLNSSQSKAV